MAGVSSMVLGTTVAGGSGSRRMSRVLASGWRALPPKTASLPLVRPKAPACRGFRCLLCAINLLSSVWKARLCPNSRVFTVSSSGCSPSLRSDITTRTFTPTTTIMLRCFPFHPWLSSSDLFRNASSVSSRHGRSFTRMSLVPTGNFYRKAANHPRSCLCNRLAP